MTPLVSVIVVTYNSEKYILETLESIYNQTYSNIELIISDDCGGDDTLTVVKRWADSIRTCGLTSERFKSIVITQTPKNKGVSGNCNYGLNLAQGEWVKYIGGDDILKPNCIEEFISYTTKSDDKVFLCCLRAFDDVTSQTKDYTLSTQWHNVNYKVQESLMIRGVDHWFPLGPALFFERKVLERVGGFDEKYPMIEDLPMCLKLLSNGYRLHVIYEQLVNYRVHFDSITHGNVRFSDSLYRARDFYLIPAARRHKMWWYWYHFKVRSAIRNKKYPKFVLYLLSGLDWLNWKEKKNRKNIATHG